MAVHYYTSEDADAPQFITSGVAKGTNNIIEIMDAILISGYGSKPGLGWTKLMESEVPGSDRTVYQNDSNHSNNMNLIVQSHPSSTNVIQMQMAEIVNSPEDYSIYSHVTSVGHNYLPARWTAVGDSATLILMFWNSNLKKNYYYVYYPVVIYIGDVDTQGINNPNAWALISPGMFAGTLDTVTSNYQGAAALSEIEKDVRDKALYRPFTSIPEMEWSEAGTPFKCTAFMSGRSARVFWPSYVEGYQDIEEFKQNVSIKSPWYIVFNHKWSYRLRGLYSLFPYLFIYNKENNSQNTLIPFLIDDTEYILTGMHSGLFIQTSGDW